MMMRKAAVIWELYACAQLSQILGLSKTFNRDAFVTVCVEEEAAPSGLI